VRERRQHPSYIIRRDRGSSAERYVYEREVPARLDYGNYSPAEEYARPAEPGFSLVVHGWLRRRWNPRCVSRRINFLAKRRRRRRRRASRMRERNSAKPRLRPRVVKRVLATGVRT